MCADSFTRAPIYEPQVRHRILAPLIAFALGLRGVSGAAVPVMANTALLTLLFVMMRRQVSTASAAGSVLLQATTLVIVSSQTWLGYSDSLGHLGVLACMMLRSIWWLPIPMYLGMLGEERSAAAIPLIVLWHFLRDGPERRWLDAALRLMLLSLAVALWIYTYGVMKRAFAIQFPPDAAGLACS